MNEYPKVTIIIANHNYGQYLKDAIDSAINQNYPKDKLCIWVIDDVSTDNSWQILHKHYFKQISHEKKDLEYWHIKKGILDNGVQIVGAKLLISSGPSKARNIAIQNTLSKTDIYAILDADDIYYPNKIIKCVSKIMSAPTAIGVVYADYDILNVETGNIIREHKEPFDKIRLHQECIVHSGAIINKIALEQTGELTGFYDETMRTCEDYDLWMRISDKFIIVHVPESLSLVRVHKANATFSVHNDIWKQNWTRVQQKAINRQNVKNNL